MSFQCRFSVISVSFWYYSERIVWEMLYRRNSSEITRRRGWDRCRGVAGRRRGRQGRCGWHRHRWLSPRNRKKAIRSAGLLSAVVPFSAAYRGSWTTAYRSSILIESWSSSLIIHSAINDCQCILITRPIDYRFKYAFIHKKCSAGYWAQLHY